LEIFQLHFFGAGAQSGGVGQSVYPGMESVGFLSFARARSVFWQALLCQSVRLYLALGEPGVAAAEAEAVLRGVEGQMVWHLLAGQELTPLVAAEAWAIVDAAQHQLLASPPDLADCLRQLSASQSLHLVQAPGQA